MQTEDGVEYDAEELAVLARSGSECPRIVHTVKKVFGGDVVEWKPTPMTPVSDWTQESNTNVSIQ